MAKWPKRGREEALQPFATVPNLENFTIIPEMKRCSTPVFLNCYNSFFSLKFSVKATYLPPYLKIFMIGLTFHFKF
ncbi:uncharacterized protein G2W53_041199 [Senna tora]|uniref:Uncharacterized protein n=1 Tax=Senna tora TaxID=362788 RepID=A0A834SEG6_9FABA|nr:uncharacterized protein G2W53_041199 [Senna tora]